MDDPKTREHDAEDADELRAPQDRVEDLEPADTDADDVKGGAVDMFLKIDR